MLPGMLHLAILRSPFAHARSPASTVSRAGGARCDRRVQRRRPGRRAGRAACRLAGHRRPMAPDYPPLAVDKVATSARPSRSSWPGPRPRADAPTVEVDYEALPAALDMEAAARTRCSCTPTRAPTSAPHWLLRLGRGRHRRRRRRGDRRGAEVGIVIERGYRQQRLIPAFMEPRSSSSTRPASRLTVWSATQVPHLVRLHARGDHRHPGAQDPRDRPRRRRRLRRQAAGHAGGVCSRRRARRGKPVKYTETRSESLVSGPPRPRPVAEAHPRRRRDGTVTGLKVDLLANMGAYLGLVTPACRCSAR